MSQTILSLAPVERGPTHHVSAPRDFAVRRRCRRIVVAALWMVLGVFGRLLALAQSPVNIDLTVAERTWLAQHGEKAVLWFNTDFPPIEFASAAGEFVGMGADIIALVEKRLGVVFRKVASNDWNAHLAALESGECAIAPTIVATAERERYAFFTTPYATVPVVIIARRQIGHDLSLADLAGRRVAVVSGYATENYARELGRDRFEVVPVSIVPEGLRRVSFGEADAFLENLAVAAYYIDKEGIPNLHVAGDTAYAFAWSIGVSRRYPLLYSAIQKSLNTISPAELEAARKRWIFLEMEGWLSPEARRWLWIVNAFVALLLLGFGGIAYFLKRRLNQKVASLKQAQQEILDQAELLRLAMEATQAGAWDYRPETRTAHLSGQWFAMLGYEPKGEEVPLDTIRSWMHPEDLPAVDRAFRDCISGGRQGKLEIEFRFRRADGTWCWVLSKGRAVAWNDQGLATRIIGLDTNIQSVKEAREKIVQSEARFRAIFENAPYSIVISDPEDGRLLEANNEFLARRQMRREDLATANIRDFSTVTEEQMAQIVRTLMESGTIKNRETMVKRTDGSTGYVIFSAVLLDILGRKQIVTTTVDVTERKRAEEALRASEDKLRSLFAAIKDLIFVLDKDGRYLEIAPTDTGYLYRPTNELVGRTLKEVFPAEKAKLFVQAIEKALSQQRRVILDYDLTIEARPIWFSASISPLSAERVIVVARDVTERKRAEAEREKLQGQLLQSQKLEAVGILAGGVAHDFNNMLGAIIGYAELTMGLMEPDNPLRANLGKILDAAQRSAGLTRQLLAFARKQTIAPVVLDLNEAVEGILNMLRRLIGENIELAWRPGSGPSTVKMDPAQIDQVLANLCVNARDAIADVGRISIETQAVFLDEAFCGSHVGVNPGAYVLLAVSDDGCGMDRETLAQIFEPFFTTKGVGQGTGLGLATVYGIVKQNEGLIDVYSEPGKGTTFKLYIPRHADGGAAVKTSIVEEIPPGQGETVLIVEDDPILLEIVKMMLQRLGYTILFAANPAEAIALAEKETSEIQLFITDVVMPEMNGRDLAERLRTIRPGIKHLFMSGYTADVIVHQGVLDEGVHFIQKPFSLQELAVKIREALE